MKKIEGNIVDVVAREIYPASLIIENDVIVDVIKNNNIYSEYIIPGFIDSHVHIESSMLTPSNFSKLVSKNGTVAIVSDPHEIANVLGIEGIKYMINNAKNADIKINFTIPSCVPATPLDASGACISAEDVDKLFKSNNFIGLSEMMNVPGVLAGDKEVMEKINSALKRNLVVDGHAPLLIGEELKKYIAAGISTDHECSELDEAREKIYNGMKIIIREGSAAENYEKLKSLIATNSDDLMFCTDDSHPDSIIKYGGIKKIVKMAIRDGFDIFDVLKIACINPILHYNLNVGTLKVGDKADFIKIENLKSFEVIDTYISGRKIYQNNEFSKSTDSTLHVNKEILPNNFNHDLITKDQLVLSVNKNIYAIGVIPGELLTTKNKVVVEKSDNLESDISKDLLKIVYINRYSNSLPQVGYVVGFGFKKGAIASSISHDSHNIIAVGCSDIEIEHAVNTIIKNKGGLSVAYKKDNSIFTDELPLPIAGIMSNRDGEYVAKKYSNLSKLALTLGCKIKAPFMTLAFMSLLVIPEFKIGENGMFDYSKFSFIN